MLPPIGCLTHTKPRFFAKANKLIVGFEGPADTGSKGALNAPNDIYGLDAILLVREAHTD